MTTLVTKSIDEALALDKKNGNTLWADAIAKEMKNVRLLSVSCRTENERLSVTNAFIATWYLT